VAWKALLEGEHHLPERVYIFDTTMRDGEQTPGAALRPEDKVKLAQELDELGVDIIEAGFPLVSSGELKAFREISRLGLQAKVCALARCEKLDIDAALDVDVDWIHTFIASSDIHLHHKLMMTREQVLERARDMVEYAKQHGVTVHFSAEDATRTEPAFLMQLFREVEKSGADSIDIPDTVGTAVPYAMRHIVRLTKQTVNVPVAVHCHDDFGMAVANSLAGVEAGAEIVHATINGIGERAGNASLEEVVSSLAFLYGIKTNVKLLRLSRVSRLVEKMTGIIVPKNKAIVGENSFAHESGIHVHGVLGSPYTYEPVMPETFGRRRRIIFGKHSGKHGLEALLKEYGFTTDGEPAKLVLAKIKEIGDAGGKISEEDIISTAEKVYGLAAQIYGQKRLAVSKVQKLTVSRMGDEGYDAFCELYVGNECVSGRAVGRNSVHASLMAGLNAVGLLASMELVDYKVQTSNHDTHPAEAEVILRLGDMEAVGRGIDYDPALAVVKAVASSAHQLLMAETYVKSMER